MVALIFCIKPKSVIRDIRHETPIFLMTAIRKLRMYSVV